MREPKIIMVPGYGNSGPDHWQSIWQARLPGATRMQVPESGGTATYMSAGSAD